MRNSRRQAHGKRINDLRYTEMLFGDILRDHNLGLSGLVEPDVIERIVEDRLGGDLLHKIHDLQKSQAL